MKSINQYIDHTYLKADCDKKIIQQVVQEAIDHQFYAICIPSHYISYAQNLTKNSSVKICTVVGFPLGYQFSKCKLEETKIALDHGADEIDMVINISAARDEEFHLIEDEIMNIKNLVHKNHKILKVIIETCYHDANAIAKLSQIVSHAKADFIKTSTGFGPYGARLEDILIMKNNIDPSIKIKASGGIKNFEQAMQYLSLGVQRLGTSSGVEIIQHREGISGY